MKETTRLEMTLAFILVIRIEWKGVDFPLSLLFMFVLSV